MQKNENFDQTLLTVTLQKLAKKLIALHYAYFFAAGRFETSRERFQGGLALRMISARRGSDTKNDQCQTPYRPLPVSWKTYPPFFHFDGLPCLQNCPNGESEVIRSGCVEVIDECGPTIYNCKLNSLASGKREALDVIFIIFGFLKVQANL